MKIKKLLAALTVGALCLAMPGCARNNGNSDAPVSQSPPSETTAENRGDLLIVYTSDIHGAYSRNDDLGQMGFAAVAEYRDQLEKQGGTVLLVDGGDALQADTREQASALIGLMNAAGYDFAAPGDADLSVDDFLDLAENEAEYRYLSCNLLDLTSGEPVFPAYETVACGDVNVAFIGICTPESDGGRYDLAPDQLYDRVQSAIDEAKMAGADYVVAIGHLGIEPASTPWTSVEVIAHTTGLSAFLDGHSHSLVEQEYISDKDDNSVLLCAVGEGLTAIAQIRLDLNTGSATAIQVTGLTEEDSQVLSEINDIADLMKEPEETTQATTETP